MSDDESLMRRMAGVVGAELARVPPPLLAKAQARCDGCAEAVACHSWLAGNAAGTVEVPAYCRNAVLFDGLSLT